jgi:hypothetical protein
MPQSRTPSQRLTIDDVAKSLFFGDTKTWTIKADWPPDVFAVAAYILQVSGIYRKAICNCWWSEIDPKHPAHLQQAGGAWRRNAAMGRPAPKAVLDAWLILKTNKGRHLCEIGKYRRVVKALFDLVGMADAACEGFGVPNPNYSSAEPEFSLLLRADELLGRGAMGGGTSTLCERICPDIVCVLPKSRTPQVGITFRSLTHNIALYVADEIKPIWYNIDSTQARRDEEGFNILLIPNPYSIDNSQFEVVKHTRSGRHRLPTEYRYFKFNPKSNRNWIETELSKILLAALAKTESRFINAVIFPELSFASRDEFERAYYILQEIIPGACLIAGVAEAASEGDQEIGRNCAYYAIPIIEEKKASDATHILCTQAKHHKWQLTKSQINGYGLELDATKTWWEYIDIEERALNFYALKQWLTMAFIICEDLARQEPASRLLRAIGPNLIIALLMDNEQVATRWPARYATVLAEDPGSSVLTFTCQGMAQRGAQIFYHSRIPGKITIALWRDGTGEQAIKIRKGASAILLNLERQTVTDYSLDGRSAVRDSLILPKNAKAIQQIVVK